MRHLLSAAIAMSCVTLCARLLLVAPDAKITGAVIGDAGQPVAGATVQVVQDAAKPPCRATTAADGTFALSCAVAGRYAVRASLGELRPWQIDEVELGPGREVYLNFMLLSGTQPLSAETAPKDTAEAMGLWQRRLPNPVVATWQGRAITLRLAAIAIAAVSFVLGAVTMLGLGRRFGMETRRLSSTEVGDMVLNPSMPSAGERVSPLVVAGGRGASATISYGAEEIAAALAGKRYGVVFVALVIAPVLFGLFSCALAVAMLVGQELYLFCAMLLVPVGFMVTPIVIGLQALKRRQGTV